eukprot:TRINITY_DN40905_c0_g1_i1.p1 TRINITY_DN40905_c0_g1~~TRINITY_DN40905_c0_g1_i1.p1  ORF type:complete len:486 (-),score=92.03 TRINITY_DN40905_c0_g1_i1:89-1546(-)
MDNDDCNAEGSTELYTGSSTFDPHAQEFLPGDSLDSVGDVSWGGSSHGGSFEGSATSFGSQGSSLVFGGGGDFLSKYQNVGKRQERDRSASGEVGPRGPRYRKGSSDCGSSRSNPAPDRVNVQLNSLLVNARAVDKILQVVDTHFNHFNAVNMITALHRLATEVIVARRGALRRDPRFKRLIYRLSETLRSANAGALKPQDLSNVAWALTKLGLLNAVLFGHLSDHIESTIRDFEPVNLSMTLWAFARSGFLDEKLFLASAAEVKRQLPDFQPQQIANTTWAMAKSGFVDRVLFESAADLALEKLADFQPMNYSMLLYSFALAKLPHPRLFEEVGKRCTVQALSSAMSAPHVVTNLALAFSEAGVVNAGVFDTIAKVASNTLHEFRAQQITTLAKAFAAAQVKHDRLFSAITSSVVARLAQFKPQDIQGLLSSYERLGIPTGDIGRALDTQHSDQDLGSNFWSILTALAFVLLVILIGWRVTTSW